MSENYEHEKLVRLIHRIAGEEAWKVIEEHLEDYEHKEKPAGNIGVE